MKPVHKIDSGSYYVKIRSGVTQKEQDLLRNLDSSTSQLLLVLFISFLVLHLPGPLRAQQHLPVPVHLEVDQGDVSSVSVKVTKGGKAAFTQSGASKMQIRLELDRKYLLTFSRQGLITRKFAVDTHIPSGYKSDGLTPFPIQVRLIRQHDGDPLVLKQKPEEIHFDKSRGEFAFKTDHNRDSPVPPGGAVLATASATSSLRNKSEPGKWQATGEEVKITREDTHEERKIVTTIRVIRNGVAVEYHRVSHDWGGVFYFKNRTNSIPETLFMQWTGLRF